MIPKVATNLLHFSAARVAAAAQQATQTITPTFRSVLQYQTQQAANAGVSSTGTTVGWNAANSGLGTSSSGGASASAYDTGKGFYNAYQDITLDPSFASSNQDDDQRKRKASSHRRQRPINHLIRRPPPGALITPSARLAAQARFLHTRALQREQKREAAAAAASASKRENVEANEELAVVLSPKSSRPYATSSSASASPEVSDEGTSASGSAPPTTATADAVEASFEGLGQEAEAFIDSATLPTDPSTPQSVYPPNIHHSFRGKHPAMLSLMALVNNSTTKAVTRGKKRNTKAEKRELDSLIAKMKEDRVLDRDAWSCALWATIRLRVPGESLRPAITLYNDLLSGNILPPVSSSKQKRESWKEGLRKAKGKGTESESTGMELVEEKGQVVIPSDRVVSLLIKALALRDAEVAEELKSLEAVEDRYRPLMPTGDSTVASLKKMEELKKENNFAPAMALITATLQTRYPKSLGVTTYNMLLQSALNHQKRTVEEAKGNEGEQKNVSAEIGGIPSAITVFAHLEKSGTRPSARTFGLLLQIYATAKDLEGAHEVWNEFRSACARGSLDWILHDTPPSSSSSTTRTLPWFQRAGPVNAETPLSRQAIRSLIGVWSEMIEVHFACGDPSGGLSFLEKMMDAPFVAPPKTLAQDAENSGNEENKQDLESSSVPLLTPVDVPPPAPETYYGVVRSFLNAGDIDTALAWFKRLLEQDPDPLRDGPDSALKRQLASHGGLRWDPIVTPPRPNRQLWDSVLGSLFERGMVLELNELMDYANTMASRYLEQGVKRELAKKQEGEAVDLEKVIRRVSAEDVALVDKRDAHHWSLAWRVNVAAMEAPRVPAETKRACLDWIRTRVVDRAFFKPNHSTFAIVDPPAKAEAPNSQPAYEDLSLDKGEEEPDRFVHLNPAITHRRRLTENVGQGLRDRAWHAVGLYVHQGRIDESIELASLLFNKERDEILENEKAEMSLEQQKKMKDGNASEEWTAGLGTGEKTLHALADLRSLVAGLEETIWTYGSESKKYPSLQGAVNLTRLTSNAGLMPAMRPAWYIVNSFLSHKDDPDFKAIMSSPADWVNLAKTFAATAMSVFYDDNRPAPNPELAWQLKTFLHMMKDNGKTWDDIGRNNVYRIYKILEHHLGKEELDKTLSELGDEFKAPEKHFPKHVNRSGAAEVKTTAPAESKAKIDVQPVIDATREKLKTEKSTHPLTITPAQSSYIYEGVYPSHSPHGGSGTVSPQVGYERLVAGYRIGDVPSPENIARLIVSLGHQRAKDKIVKCYEIGNEVLATLEHNKSWQASGWTALEDSMVTALAHCGDMKSASLHRARLVSQGGAPSASAYGALIANIKDTTDNASVAIELFEESRRLGVEPNSYLYNTIISRLAKARKADYAMLLFQTMKNAGLQPTEVTYGAVIAGCARIGDATTAETLFEEMTALPGYKPRIPPFNTMMQLYTHVKPNRERALYYYSLMEKMGVSPTPYTYKLMLDMYGKNEPVDVAKMDEIIATMKARNVEITGNHYSSLIIAHGCTMQNLDSALQIFETLRTSRPTNSSLWPMGRRASHRVTLPDVLAYEALLNVLVTHHRIDLMQEYFTQMIKKDRVRPTAYIYNLLIKGWASVGDLTAARDVFERMVDPPAGAAAPNNHAPHMGHEGPQMVNGSIEGQVEDPVYREPSSWEAMVRAELSVGDRDRANALLQRMKARYYPAAVTAKIENILWEPNHAEVNRAVSPR